MNDLIEQSKSNRSVLIVKNCNFTSSEIDDMINKWKINGKPSRITASFVEIKDLQEIHIDHFKTCPYSWKPMQGNIFGGLWLNDSLEYIHLVLATETVLEYILNLNYE